MVTDNSGTKPHVSHLVGAKNLSNILATRVAAQKSMSSERICGADFKGAGF